MHFCSRTQADSINPSLNEILTFLTTLHDEGLGYSAINTAKSMLSVIFEVIHKRDIGKEVLVKRFMKGIFHIRPSLPKFNVTWDVKVVLKFLEKLENIKVTLRVLSIKLCLLLILATGQRCQTLHAISIANMVINEKYVKIRIGELMKQSKPHRHLNELYIEAFEHNVSICVVHVLNEYLNRTKDIRSGPELFITTQSPFKAASKSTIANWIKIGLRMAGIDMDMFTPHSTRSASTSAVVTKIPIDTIIRTAGWASDCTFRKFYKRPITNDSSFSVALLT